MTATIRRVYPVLIALLMALQLAGCATTNTATILPEVPAMHSVKEIDDEYVKHTDSDPWVGFNKSMYRFDYNLDQYVLLPVVNAYEFVTPQVAQTGVSNFYNNIAEVRTFYNSLLQAKGTKSLLTFGRFVTNSTIGLAGFFDPATSFGMKRQNEDFGQTLGVWGVGSGPYLVMPLIGPGTVRSFSGFVVDSGIHYALRSSLDFSHNSSSDSTRDALLGVATVVKTIDNRHQQSFRYLDSGYPFEYELTRYMFRQSREMQVMK